MSQLVVSAAIPPVKPVPVRRLLDNSDELLIPLDYKSPDKYPMFEVAKLINRHGPNLVSKGKGYYFGSRKEALGYLNYNNQLGRNSEAIVIYWFDYEHGFEVQPRILQSEKECAGLIRSYQFAYPCIA